MDFQNNFKIMKIKKALIMINKFKASLNLFDFE